MIYRYALMAVMASQCCSAQAQNAVGRGLVDGREAVLFDDNTWAMADPSLRGCDDLLPWLRFCGNISTWIPFEMHQDNSWGFQYGGYEFGYVVTYDVGFNDDFGPTDALFSHYENILDNPNGNIENLTYMHGYTFGDESTEWFVAVFFVELPGGNTLTAAASEVLLDNSVAILITETSARTYDPAHRYMHETFLNLFQVVGS